MKAKVTLDDKALRYVSEGRVRAQTIIDGHALFHVSGSDPGDPYYVRFTPHGGWKCDCPARVPECAHVKACMMVCDLTKSAEPSPGFSPDRDTSIDALLSGL